MIDNNILCLIPARSGSKGIPNKNVKSLLGHPLMAYSIAAGLQVGTRVIVSTNDLNYGRVAEFYGAEVIIRPEEFAQDDSPDIDVFMHAVKQLKAQEGYTPEMIVHLRPTTPFRPPDLVKRAVSLYRALSNQYEDKLSLRGVVPATPPPEKVYEEDSGFLYSLLSDIRAYEPYNRPRQSLGSYWFHNGVIDVTHPDIILSRWMSGEFICPMKLNPEYSIDLDTPSDWEYAEWKLKQTSLPMVKP